MAGDYSFLPFFYFPGIPAYTKFNPAELDSFQYPLRGESALGDFQLINYKRIFSVLVCYGRSRRVRH